MEFLKSIPDRHEALKKRIHAFRLGLELGLGLGMELGLGLDGVFEKYS
jgi:hypothetical protein